jgi:hypothetical protein
MGWIPERFRGAVPLNLFDVSRLMGSPVRQPEISNYVRGFPEIDSGSRETALAYELKELITPFCWLVDFYLCLVLVVKKDYLLFPLFLCCLEF